MAKERNGFITMKPEDFVVVDGSPYYPASLVGEEGDHLVPSRYRCVFIDGQPWVAFGFMAGTLHAMAQRVQKLNKGIGIDGELSGVKFAVGPNYNWYQKRGMAKDQGGMYPYRIWVNRHPPNDPKDVVRVQEAVSDV